MKLKIIAAGPDSPAHLENPERLAHQSSPHANGFIHGESQGDLGRGGANGHEHGHGGDHHVGRSPARYEPRIFASPDHQARSETLAVLAAELKDADLAAPPVVLPDFYHKHNMEMPSSIAVATLDSIRPTLTSASVNCGMALITFDSGKPSQDQITRFYDRVRTAYPFPPTKRLDLTFDEVVRCAVEGAEFAVGRWNIDPDELLRVEEGGRLDLEPFGGMQRVREEIPWLLLQLSRMRFGTIGPSNHFVELQEVEEILEPEIAAKLGLHQGQIALQFHAGGGLLTGAVGALYGSRKGGNGLLKKIMRGQKPLHHLATARSFSELRQRFALYFAGDCPPVPRGSAEGERLMVSNAAAMNYGFAFRLRAYSELRRMAADSFGTSSQLIVDSPHNSIYEEEVAGRSALVHRHNTVRAYPAARMTGHAIFGQTGQPVLVPGTNRTCSYLCVGSDGSDQALFSACHGTGSIIDDFASRGLSSADPEGHTTLRFSYKHPEPKVVQHLDNRGVDEGISILASNDIVKPVARLRPFAVLN
jgi:tRNA-splicing ligase RtcB (3'-phosphate/5'-hydroxy nucleic acid ligase)